MTTNRRGERLDGGRRSAHKAGPKPVVTLVQGLRSSGAAGKHDSRVRRQRTRQTAQRAAEREYA